MSRRAAELLLAVARRRWPVEIRADLGREWAAELHVLAERGQRLRMLRFAASLAARRSGVDVADRAPIARRLLRTTLPLLLAPSACVGVVLVSLFAMNVVVEWLSWRVGWAFDLQLPIATVVTLCAAVGLAVFARRLARGGAPSGGWRVSFGIVAPVALTLAAAGYAVLDDSDALARVAPGLVLWLAGLALVLRVTTGTAGRGRVRLAWCVGVLGAIVVADLATILAVLSHVPTGPGTAVDGVPQGVDPAFAPLWLLACYTGSALGLPGPTGQEIFLITDAVLLEPLLYLACTPYALAWAIRAARERPASTADVVAPSPVVGPS
ncbi:hypothetical protein [Micromonospora sp. CPCC 205546]|uniref:hypothetical protein n=1 Tax=Micromonospora sp. CPCC 205546 TaxID=3122397 RepID=UPI002FEFC917